MSQSKDNKNNRKIANQMKKIELIKIYIDFSLNLETNALGKHDGLKIRNLSSPAKEDRKRKEIKPEERIIREPV